MRHHSRRARFTRCRLINGYFPALERIDAFLEEENPELEEAKLKRAMILLFGEDPIGYFSPAENINAVEPIPMS